jgi:Immunoglobulin-like domain of bacterial spore germination
MSSAGTGLLRMTLPSMSRTAVSDGTFGDTLLEGFYVVRAPEGGLVVDVLTRESFYRVLELSDPARLVVDFKPTGSPLKTPPPAVGGDTVVLEPRAGTQIGPPLTVCGCSRNFEAPNTIILTNPEGKAVVRRTVLSNDWASTWGYFEATLDLRPFRGKGTLRVGTESTRDGTLEGVEVLVRGR